MTHENNKDLNSPEVQKRIVKAESENNGKLSNFDQKLKKALGNDDVPEPK